MTDGCRRLALSMGLPPDTLPSDVLAVSVHRRETRRRDIIDNALAVGKLVTATMTGGRMEDVFSHLFTEQELNEIAAKREEEEQRAAELAQVMKLMQWSERRER